MAMFDPFIFFTSLTFTVIFLIFLRALRVDINDLFRLKKQRSGTAITVKEGDNYLDLTHSGQSVVCCSLLFFYKFKCLRSRTRSALTSLTFCISIMLSGEVRII